MCQPVHLTLDLKVPPRHAGIHRVPVLKLEKVKVKFDDMVKCGKLKKADQPTNWCSNMTVREKVLPNGTTKVCLDPSQTLNKAMIILGYQIATIQEILPRLRLEKHKNFSIFNTLDGLTQVVLTDESSLLTTPWVDIAGSAFLMVLVVLRRNWAATKLFGTSHTIG